MCSHERNFLPGKPRAFADANTDCISQRYDRGPPKVKSTYPERRVGEQLTRDLMLVYLDRGELPEAVTLVLRPKGKYRVPDRRSLRSRCGLSSCSLEWRVVELWTVPADELLSAGDVGLIPWVPLSEFAEPPETIIRRCRDTIEHQAPASEKANLLAVTQVLKDSRQV